VAKLIVMDEFHVTLSASRGLPEAAYSAIHRALDEPRFHTQLKRAIRDVMRRYPALGSVRVRLTR